MTENPTGVDQAAQPYKDDTSDGTTAKTAQEVAEETAGDVKATDDLAREAAGREHPVDGHDVRDYRPLDTEAANDPANPGHPDYQPPAPTDDSVPDGTQIPTEDDGPAEEGDAGVPDPEPTDA